MSDTKVGILLSEAAQRDAIHIAVAPVVAGGNFRPGEHVGFMPDGRVGIRAEKKIGIIDPFLENGVCANERCFIFLYPQTVTGMRHHWEHPAFNATTQTTDATAASFKWLSEFCATHNVPFDDLIEGVKGFVVSGDGWRYVQQGSTSLRDGNAATPEFWAHFTAYTGVIVPPDKVGENPFCCSC